MEPAWKSFHKTNSITSTTLAMVLCRHERVHCYEWWNIASWLTAKPCSVPTTHPPQCTQGNPPTAGSLQSPLLGGGSMGSKLIYWIVHEEKCMWSTACPPGLSPLFTHGTIILSFSINEFLVENETLFSGITALTTSNTSFREKKKKTVLWSPKRSLYFIALNMTCNLEMNLWTGLWYMLHTAVIYYC